MPAQSNLVRPTLVVVRFFHRSPAVAALVVALFFVLGLAPHAQAQASEGLAVSSTTVYTPDPANEEVTMSATYTLTNVQADEVVGDSVRSYFFTTWIIAMPANVTDLVATAAGSTLTTTIEPDPDSDSIVFGSITLPWNLQFQQSVTLDVSYTIPSAEPRSDGGGTRVNNSFLSFSIWASGDPGMTDVRVTIPPGFGMELRGDLDELSRMTRNGENFFEATDIEEPSNFFGQVFGRNDDGLITEQAQLPDATATVRAWPDDPEWAAFVVAAIENDVPVMEDLTGLDWPAGDIEVIETVTPYLYGYGGWFNATSGLIEIGDSLERDLILHELAHAWFNDDLIEGRWITEGLSEEFASRTIEANGGEMLSPDKPDLNSPVRVPLASWASPWSLDQSEAFDYEQYHYNASWWVIRAVTDQIGLEKFAEILVALDNDEIAYAGEGPPEKTNLSTRWMHLFDLLETRTSVRGLDELFSTYVLTDMQREQLTMRVDTLDAYEDFTQRSGSWGPPLLVRDLLSAWSFDGAADAMMLADRVLDAREESDQLAAELGVLVEHVAERAYEDADTARALSLARTTEVDLHTRLTSLQDQRVELESDAAALGVEIAYPELMLSDALLDLGTQHAAVEELRDLRSQVDERATELSLVSPGWPTADSSTDFAAGNSLAQARLATLDAIDAEQQRVDDPRRLTERIGLIGSDPAQLIESARTSFENDELDDALSATNDAELLLLNAAAKGRTRVVWTVISAAGLLTIGLVVNLLKRNRQDHQPASREQ